MKKSFTRYFLFLTMILLSTCGQNQTKPEKVAPDHQVTILRIWQTESDQGAKAVFNKIIQAFEARNPNVRVEHEAVSWSALSQKLTAALSTGNTPDLVHLQPFMAASLWRKGLLEPIDDVITSIGPERIFESVRDLQYFDGHYYGIAYAIGTTYFSYRRDWAEAKGLAVPKTWQEYLTFAKALTQDTDSDGKIDRFGVVLPGGSPFFMDQLTAELVASNGGRLFDPNGKPTFTEKEVIQTLQFWQELVKYAPPDWTSEGYVEQFRSFATGKTATVPVTYARASKQIANDAPTEIADPANFAVMEQPLGPSGNTSFATIDAEPWSIFKSSEAVQEAKAFLKFFYRKENYLEFCSQVPIHLMPIIREYAEDDHYQKDPFIQKWRPWSNASLKMISENRVKPILLAEDDDRKLPFLMELQGSRIITDMVLAVTLEGKDPKQAAAEGQAKAEAFIERLGYRHW